MSAAVFLISIVFDLYAFIVLARILLAYHRLDFHNPVSRVVVQLTDPVLRPLRRLIPGWAGIDWAAVLLVVGLELVVVTVLHLIVLGAPPTAITLALWSAVRAILALLNLLMFAVFVRVLLSWIGPQGYNPATAIIFGLTEPLMRPVRRRLPRLEGLDLSPMLVLIGLMALRLASRDLSQLPFWL
jgi:YggT family protein